MWNVASTLRGTGSGLDGTPPPGAGRLPLCFLCFLSLILCLTMAALWWESYDWYMRMVYHFRAPALNTAMRARQYALRIEPVSDLGVSCPVLQHLEPPVINLCSRRIQLHVLISATDGRLDVAE